MFGRCLRSNDRGFTLVELMMVILLLGILAGVAVPMLDPLKDKAWNAKLMTVSDTIGLAVVTDAIPVTGPYQFPSDQDRLNALLYRLVSLPNDVTVQLGGNPPAPGTGAMLRVLYAAGAQQFQVNGYYNGKELFAGRTYRWQ